MLILACEDGLTNQVDPGAPTVGSSYDQEQDDRFPVLPLTLGDAITAFEQDEVLRAGLGEDLSALLIDFHADEWARFCGTVTDWERTMYWDDTP
jgi:glutamine synthetase